MKAEILVFIIACTVATKHCQTVALAWDVTSLLLYQHAARTTIREWGRKGWLCHGSIVDSL